MAVNKVWCIDYKPWNTLCLLVYCILFCGLKIKLFPVLCKVYVSVGGKKKKRAAGSFLLYAFYSKIYWELGTVYILLPAVSGKKNIHAIWSMHPGHGNSIRTLWIRQWNHVYYFVCGKYCYTVKILLNLRFLSSYQTSTTHEQKMNVMTYVEKITISV